MITILICMFAGIAIGWLFRKQKTKYLEEALMGIIWLLLFLLGVNLGSNDKVFESLGTIGVESLVIGTVTTFGSVIASWLLWKNIQKGKV